MRHVALLRGINLASHRRVPMARLRELALELGLGRPETHLSSGNLIVDFDGGPDELAERLETALSADLGFPVPVLVRNPSELARIVRENPLAEVADDERRLLVCFCSRTPALAPLRAAATAPERVAVGERVAYVWTPEGVRTSNALRLLSGPRSEVLSTARNVRVVRRLAELATG